MTEGTVVALTMLLIGGGAACAMNQTDPAPPDADDQVTVTHAADTAVITNHTAAPIWTFIAGRQVLTTMFWTPQLDDEPIAPGDSMRISFADIPQQGSEREIMVYWWHAVERDGERVPGDPRSIVIER